MAARQVKTINVETAAQAFDVLRAMGRADQLVMPRMLGDMLVIPDGLPAKIWKALAAISLRGHAAYDECSGVPAGGSRDKCLFMSLAVRDFLVQIGYRDATARPCFLFINAEDRQGKELWSVGIGAPGQREIKENFNGHAVCTVPSLQLLIDCTMYQAIRPQWDGAVSGMAAVQYHAPWPDQKVHGCPSIAGTEARVPDRRVLMLWLDRPELPWKQSLDFRIKNGRRRYVTKAMREAFGEWHG